MPELWSEELMTKPRLPLLGNMAPPSDALPAEVRRHVAEELAQLVQLAHEFAAKRGSEHIAAGTMDPGAIATATCDMYDLAGLLRDRAQQWRSS